MSRNSSLSIPVLAFYYFFHLIVNPPASAPTFEFVVVVVVILVILVIAKIDRRAPALAPRHELVPADDALAALIPAHAQAPPKILRYAAGPSSLTNRAIDRVDVFPPLVRSHLGKISGR